MKPAGHIFMVLSGLALAAGIAYALLAKELAGAVMLSVFAVALVYIATVLTNAAPYDTAENDPDAEPQIGPEHMMPGSWWPLVMAVGAGAFVLGLKFNIVIMGLGIGVFLAAAAGWFVQAGRHHEEKAAHHAAAAGHSEPGH